MWRLVRTDCENKPICPSVYRTERDTTVIQGWVVDDSDPTLVEVPASLLDGLPWCGQSATGRGTWLVRGEPVGQQEALERLALPDGEQAVEVQVRWERHDADAGR
ncbi:hypothetical protein [Actinomadura rupiterrae]|uniref:hypothetical protein n=1 Tax=Actinomadura rupiterrae TaxID=559627 RepID=UPI0020A33523|nr:hypothetical protein [Actinomadura rupiterrae]MCP2341228.1 hypothetical protein [Actinomadura rupiterrae]